MTRVLATFPCLLLLLGCAGQTDAPKTEAAGGAALAAAPEQANDPAATDIPAAPADSAAAADESDMATTPVPDADSPATDTAATTDEGEWVHADTPGEAPSANGDGESTDSGNEGGAPATEADPGRAPDFKVTTLDGKVVDSAVLYGSKPVSITLWATWCPPCVAEIPTVQQLYKEHGDEVEFLAISLDDPKQLKQVEAMVKAKGMTYPVALDTKKVIGPAFEAYSIPLTVFVDGAGNEINRVEGFGGAEHLIHAFEEAFKVTGGQAGTEKKRNGSSV